MFAASEEALSLSGCKVKRPRLWPIKLTLLKIFSRRHLSGQLVCRQSPKFVAFWALIVMIFILYKLFSLDNYQEYDVVLKNSNQDKLSRDRSSDNTKFDGQGQFTTTTLNVPRRDKTVINTSDQTVLLTTTRRPEYDYVRKSKVFILLVQDEIFSNPAQALRRRIFPRRASNSKMTSSSDPLKMIDIPIHIATVIDILESHRIEYTVGTTRNGLPTSLLIDSDINPSLLQYSVIIIDDFVKYTKMGRWIRDQLDRYCRKSRIGVVTYLTPSTGSIDADIWSQVVSEAKTSKSNIMSSTKQNQQPYSSTEDEHSLADQFPLSYGSIDHRSCKNRTAKISSCLYDYQLNEKSPILRILKQRPDFILPGPLAVNVDKRAWYSMSSNHITYEPLTWARLVQPAQEASRIKRKSAPIGSGRMNTQSVDYHNGLVHLGDPSVPVPSGNQSLFTSGQKETQSRKDQDNRRQLHDDIENELMLMMYDDIDAHSSPNKTGEDGGAMIHNELSDYDANESVGNRLDNVANISGQIEQREILSMYDRGLYDGIRRVIFGGTNEHWLDRILLLDSIEHLSGGKILSPLDRFVQIDIDDIFVGERGTKLTQSDVDALVRVQAMFAKRIHGGFKFNLGFSGKFYKRGLEAEQAGDESLVSAASNFTWFCHTWSHSKAHLRNDSEAIETELRKNLVFAQAHNLPIIGYPSDLGALNELDLSCRNSLPATYAVAPHHSGVYPIHEQLYSAWQRILNVQVTSTEEYPHLRPAKGRRAFVHRAIKVLPRQTCGLYTHTIYRRKYPGGINRLLGSINGGELFNTILHNPVNIYMTHQSNYANDRLAPFAFERLFDFVQRHTNLQLRYASSDDPNESPKLGPARLAQFYFSMHPEEEHEPLWTNPCSDKRHSAIWAPEKHELCKLAPQILIVGPQKSGTTALLTFLKLNSKFRSSQLSEDDFEEVQFFNDKYYNRGVDWYFFRFLPKPPQFRLNSERQLDPWNANSNFDDNGHTQAARNGENLSTDDNNNNNSSSSSSNNNNQHRDTNNDTLEPLAARKRGQVAGPSVRGQPLFEQSSELIIIDKSATYFDDPKVARRASALLPNAYIISILINPADRAYSWYQHQRAHGDPLASSLSFEQVIKAKEDDSEQLKSLRSRCLSPGFYSQHLSRWLDFYPSRQIIIIDGEWFRLNPGAVLNRLQLLLRVQDPLDYHKVLVYDKSKGFYCQQPSDLSKRKRPLCLGPGKGRKYPQMSADARLFLNRLYWPHNRQLARILNDIGQPLPNWLMEATSLDAMSSVIRYR